jgi:hypothetical protein
MDEMPEIVIVSGAAAQETQATIEREMSAIGRDVRVLILDDFDNWSAVGDIGQLGEPLWCGVDLARGADIGSEIEVRPITRMDRIKLFDRPISDSKRTHPTTARELRRSERLRRQPRY